MVFDEFLIEIHGFSMEIRICPNVDFFVSFWELNVNKNENILSCRMLCDALNMRNHIVIDYYTLE